MLQGPDKCNYDHQSNREEAQAEIVKERIWRRLKEHPEQSPANFYENRGSWNFVWNYGPSSWEKILQKQLEDPDVVTCLLIISQY